jgi:hypothetical protein
MLLLSKSQDLHFGLGIVSAAIALIGSLQILLYPLLPIPLTISCFKTIESVMVLFY